jgi:ElaB/YqjD/DUF883 family membrane-anchored ribosome-binding protein
VATPLRAGTSSQPCAWPALESFEDTFRTGRHVVARARAATEDVVAGASLQIRRHPLKAVGAGVSAGLAIGCVIGFAAAWLIRTRG